jgi:hypothetical protein
VLIRFTKFGEINFSMSDPINNVHPREEDENLEPSPKRTKLDTETTQEKAEATKVALLPPSHALLGLAKPDQPGPDGTRQILETDVGISEYVGKGVAKIEGIIKQRFVMLLRSVHSSQASKKVHRLPRLRGRSEQQCDSSQNSGSPRTFQGSSRNNYRGTYTH